MSNITRRTLLGSGLLLVGGTLIDPRAWARTDAVLRSLPENNPAIAPREHFSSTSDGDSSGAQQ